MPKTIICHNMRKTSSEPPDSPKVGAMTRTNALETFVMEQVTKLAHKMTTALNERQQKQMEHFMDTVNDLRRRLIAEESAHSTSRVHLETNIAQL